jgi:hypothetical protein
MLPDGMPMKGLRRNDDARGNRSWYTNKKLKLGHKKSIKFVTTSKLLNP